MCELKFYRPFQDLSYRLVTPSRVCELKCITRNIDVAAAGHTLTGVWVEIWRKACYCRDRERHTLTGVWVEIYQRLSRLFFQMRHTLTGVWVEMSASLLASEYSQSHPHGCVSWNYKVGRLWTLCHVTPSRVCELKCLSCRTVRIPGSHTLTGVWVEMAISVIFTRWPQVTPSRVCELK